MNIRIVFRNMEKTPQREEQIIRELDKLNKLIDIHDPLYSIDFVITAEGVSHNIYNVEIVVDEPHGKSVAHAENYDIDLVIAHAVDALSRELHKKKSRAIDKRDRPDENHNPLRRDKEDSEK